MKSTKKTQMNFQGGVNRKATPKAADSSSTTSSKPQYNFPCEVKPAKGRTPKQGPQMNYPNGN